MSSPISHGPYRHNRMLNTAAAVVVGMAALSACAGNSEAAPADATVAEATDAAPVTTPSHTPAAPVTTEATQAPTATSTAEATVSDPVQEKNILAQESVVTMTTGIMNLVDSEANAYDSEANPRDDPLTVKRFETQFDRTGDPSAYSPSTLVSMAVQFNTESTTATPENIQSVTLTVDPVDEQGRSVFADPTYQMYLSRVEPGDSSVWQLQISHFPENGDYSPYQLFESFVPPEADIVVEPTFADAAAVEYYLDQAENLITATENNQLQLEFPPRA